MASSCSSTMVLLAAGQAWADTGFEITRRRAELAFEHDGGFGKLVVAIDATRACVTGPVCWRVVTVGERDGNQDPEAIGSGRIIFAV